MGSPWKKLWPTTTQKQVEQRARNQAKSLERPLSCSRCSQVCVPEAHHPDHSKPLEVEWLCKSCHLIADRPRRRRNPTSVSTWGTSPQKRA